MDLGLVLNFFIAYVIGAIPFSVILSKYILKKDIRKFGSGNIGTSNAYRIGGFSFSLIIGLLDIAKAFVTVKYILPGNMGILALCVGQMYPFTLNFNGGKGMGCYLGAVLANNFLIGAPLIFIWLFIVTISKSPFIASMMIILASLRLLQLDWSLALTFCLIILRHKSNIIEFFKVKNKSR